MSELDVYASRALALIDEKIKAREEFIVKQVIEAVYSDAGLSPQIAVQRWIEFITVRRIVTELQLSERRAKK